jgi:hypothetical protein
MKHNEHFTNYKNISEQVNAECARFAQNHAEYIVKGDAERVKAYSTGTRWTQYQLGKITFDQLREFALKRNAAKFERETAAKLERLAQIGAAFDAKVIRIYVDWVRSRVWGWNPKAVVEIIGTRGEYAEAVGSASGCGYDKRSAARRCGQHPAPVGKQKAN